MDKSLVERKCVPLVARIAIAQSMFLTLMI
jgi:hypothetical protein